MKRRNVDTSKQPRRPLKRPNKFTDSVYGSSFVYIKFMVVWMFILLADFILEFRFEYVWPFWLLIQSVYDTFKYQGLAYSVFFVCIAITSDTVCLLFIPIQWLFFMASTYVWIHYVWHTDKGICLPTVSLWLFFMYIEATMRLRDLKNSPFHIELCKPFAAHCIGHPVVTLGIGLKSYVLYRLRLRTQHKVQKENNFYLELLKYALPKEMRQNHAISFVDKEKIEKAESNGQSNGVLPHQQSKKSQKQLAIQDSTIQIVDYPSTTSPPKSSGNSNSASGNTPVSQRKFGNTSPNGKASTESLSISLHNTTSVSPDTEMKRRNTSNHRKSNSNDSSPGQANKNSSKNSSSSNSPKSKTSSATTRTPSAVTDADKHTKLPVIAAPTLTVPPIKTAQLQPLLTNGHIISEKLPDTKIELISTPSAIERLETTISKLKNDLQAARKNELNVKDRLEYLTNLERTAKADLAQLRKDNDLLQTKLSSLLVGKEKDKVYLQSVEKRLKTEVENRTNVEKLLKDERRHRKEDEEQARTAAAAAQYSRDKESAEVLKKAKQDLEEAIVKIQNKLKAKEEECEFLKTEVAELQGREKSAKESETLMSALEAMQDKNLMLENSLSAETRLKLDLFSALGDVKRQLELAHGAIYKRDAEIADLKARLTEFLSIVPESRMRSATPHYSNNFLEKPLVPNLPAQEFQNAYCAMPARNPNMPQGPMVQSGPHGMEQNIMGHPIHLDPNAAMYTPNTSGN
uniref:Macoilin n=1 Tax=Phallusia mammillata TaxID=59560 RepID=A0A6F9DKS7_9ASCI|nr:macoilin [Phallusia mammillata]